MVTVAAVAKAAMAVVAKKRGVAQVVGVPPPNSSRELRTTSSLSYVMAISLPRVVWVGLVAALGQPTIPISILTRLASNCAAKQGS